MDSAALHAQLAALAPAVLRADHGELAEVEAHVAAGCSRCARALVNAWDAAVAVAEVSPAAAPRTGLRDRILSGARGGALAARQGQTPRRFFDPSGEVARLHFGGPGDAERVQEIDTLGVATPPEGDASGRLLAQIQGLLRFPLLFVSVVRGDRVGYRAQIGLDGAGRDRRRETSFCTHTVSAGEPMVVPDASTEPFFRGSAMVRRDGVKAYVGVPLRSTRGVVVGTVCAMDYAPRRIGPAIVRTLELYAEPIVAEIERAHRLPADRWPRTAAGAPLHPAAWFREILALAAGPLASASPDEGLPSLVVATGPDAEALADLARPDEPVGRLSAGATDTVGLLVTRAGEAEDRGVELRAELAKRVRAGRALVSNYFP